MSSAIDELRELLEEEGLGKTSLRAGLSPTAILKCLTERNEECAKNILEKMVF